MGGHVVRAVDDADAGQPKVRELDVASGADQQVVRLQVPVDDALQHVSRSLARPLYVQIFSVLHLAARLRGLQADVLSCVLIRLTYMNANKQIRDTAAALIRKRSCARQLSSRMGRQQCRLARCYPAEGSQQILAAECSAINARRFTCVWQYSSASTVSAM